ncbi:MAG: sugar transferase [Acidobacteriota bacterium]
MSDAISPTERPRGLPRALEVLLALLALLAASPVLALAAWAILRDGDAGEPVLFRQTRIGRDGKPFTLLKLRTMSRAAGSSVTAGGDPRVTRIGHWLRRLKLDELPQLWNVVRGDLALIGPRPEVPRFVDRDDPAWREVLSLRPGLADAATLRLRDEESVLARAVGAGLGAPDVVYRRILLPWKLDVSREYLRLRSPRTDWLLLLAIAVSIVRPPSPPSLEELQCSARD